MAVRNQISRQSTNYTIAKIGGIRYVIQVGAFQSMAQVYYAKRRLEQGRLAPPKTLLELGKTILVTCNGGGKFEFSTI